MDKKKVKMVETRVILLIILSTRIIKRSSSQKDAEEGEKTQ